MNQSVTTNPLIIMIINMTVVFAVLWGLSLVIRLLHYLDPTAEGKRKAVPLPKVTKTALASEAPGKGEDEIPDEVLVVLAAALAAYGYSFSQVRAIHAMDRPQWAKAGKVPVVFQRKSA